MTKAILAGHFDAMQRELAQLPKDESISTKSAARRLRRRSISGPLFSPAESNEGDTARRGSLSSGYSTASNTTIGSTTTSVTEILPHYPDTYRDGTRKEKIEAIKAIMKQEQHDLAVTDNAVMLIHMLYLLFCELHAEAIKAEHFHYDGINPKTRMKNYLMPFTEILFSYLCLLGGEVKDLDETIIKGIYTLKQVVFTENTPCIEQIKLAVFFFVETLQAMYLITEHQPSADKYYTAQVNCSDIAEQLKNPDMPEEWRRVANDMADIHRQIAQLPVNLEKRTLISELAVIKTERETEHRTLVLAMSLIALFKLPNEIDTDNLSDDALHGFSIDTLARPDHVTFDDQSSMELLTASNSLTTGVSPDQDTVAGALVATVFDISDQITTDIDLLLLYSALLAANQFGLGHVISFIQNTYMIYQSNLAGSDDNNYMLVIDPKSKKYQFHTNTNTILNCTLAFTCRIKATHVGNPNQHDFNPTISYQVNLEATVANENIAWKVVSFQSQPKHPRMLQSKTISRGEHKSTLIKDHTLAPMLSKGWCTKDADDFTGYCTELFDMIDDIEDITRADFLLAQVKKHLQEVDGTSLADTDIGQLLTALQLKLAEKAVLLKQDKQPSTPPRRI